MIAPLALSSPARPAAGDDASSLAYWIDRARLPGERAARRWRRRNQCHIERGLRQVRRAAAAGCPTLFGALELRVLRADGGEIDLGVVSLAVVTNNAVAYIVQVFIATGGYNLNSFKYHGLGTGTNAESASDTALQTEITTAYATDNVRPTGTTVQGATANVFQTVATNTVDASVAATEHGIFSQAATGGGTLFDRSVFAVVNLPSGGGLQSTYNLTLSAGG